MKWRLLAAFAGLITVVLLAQDIPLTTYLRRIEFERLVSTLERDAFLLGGRAENALTVTGPPDAPLVAELQAAINEYTLTHPGGTVIVTDAEGALAASTQASHASGDDFSNRPEIGLAIKGNPTSGERNSKTAGGNLVYVAVPVLHGAALVGAVRITFPAKIIDTRAWEKTRGLLVVGGISLLGAAVAAILMASYITSPLRRLRGSTERIAEGDFSERAEVEGAPEVRSLARSFNSMTARVSRLLDQQRAFAGDASHQLRTPLTALRLQLERAAEQVDTNPDGARERIEAATAETERLQRLVEGLLMIARSEGTSPETDTIDVSALVRDRYEVWEPFASERGVHLAINAPEGLMVHAVPNALEQIIDNYVDNALGVAEDGDTISIVATAYHDAVGVHVIDEGPGMRPEHLAHAFDRFWRAPDAPHGGSGIGLAVVQHLAELSGGHAVLRNRTDRSGLDACVVLPPAPVQAPATRRTPAQNPAPV
jgi:signal transduction histidine kinase